MIWVAVLLALIGGDEMPARRFRNPASLPDPFVMGESERPDQQNNNTGWRDTNGKTLRSKVIDPNIRTLVLITAGQSLMVNLLTNVATPSNPSMLDNLNPYDGSIYAAADPLLGTTAAFGGGGFGAGCIATLIGDQLITNGKFHRVILVPISVGGTMAFQWAENGVLNNRVTAAVNRLRYAGITASTPGVTMAAVWGQGESDNTGGTSQASYAASLTSWINTARAAGMSGRIFVNLETWNNGASATIRAAQAQVVAANGNVFFGGDIDTLDNTYRVDNVHPVSPTAAAAFKNLVVNAMAASGSPF